MKLRTIALAGLLRFWSSLFYYLQRHSRKLVASRISPEEELPEQMHAREKHDS